MLCGLEERLVGKNDRFTLTALETLEEILSIFIEEINGLFKYHSLKYTLSG